MISKNIVVGSSLMVVSFMLPISHISSAQGPRGDRGVSGVSGIPGVKGVRGRLGAQGPAGLLVSNTCDIVMTYSLFDLNKMVSVHESGVTFHSCSCWALINRYAYT